MISGTAILNMVLERHGNAVFLVQIRLFSKQKVLGIQGRAEKQDKRGS